MNGNDVTTADREESSLYDALDWMWSFRWLALVSLLIGATISVVIWATTPPPATLHNVTIQIFSGGTSVRTPQEIADMYSSHLGNEQLHLLSGRTENPLIFQALSREQAELAISQISEISDQIIQEVQELASEIRPLINENDAAMEQYLRHRAFLRGVQAGLVHIAVATTSEGTEAARPRFAWALPLMLSLVAYGVLAVLWSVWRGWSDRRRVQA